MKKNVFLYCACILILVSLVAVPALAATVTCPSSCSCLLPAEAKKIAAPGYCQGKQAVCGYDTQKNEKYCYEKPGTIAAAPRIIVTRFQIVTTTPTPVPPQKCASGCTCLSTTDGKGKGLLYCGGKQVVCGYTSDKTPLSCFAQPADPAVIGAALNTTARAAVTATVPTIVTGLYRGVPTTTGIPSVSTVNYTERYTAEVRCPSGCACLLSADAATRGLSFCGGKQMTCTASSESLAKGTGAPAETRSCYTIPVAAGTSPDLSRAAVVNRTPVIPIPLPKECPEGCSCLDAKTIRERGYADCSAEKTVCGFSKTEDVMYCAKTSSASTGQPDTIFSAIGKFFGTLFGGTPTPESHAAVDLCRQRYGLDTCNGECVDFLTDDNNCGGCGNWCNSDPGYSIELGTMYTCYDGQCVRRDDMEGPGSYRCGIGGTTECPVGAPCLEGVCSALGCLVPELTDCNNVCVRTGEDEANCGSCGYACQLNQTCRGGTCTDECEDPETGFCRSIITGQRYCADLSTDPDHCGRCQHTCPSSMICDNGVCVSE